jgi:hypothetical protein
MKRTSYYQKISTQHEKITKTMSDLEIKAQRLNLELSLMDKYGDDPGRLLLYLTMHEEQEEGYQEYTITNVIGKGTQQISQDIGISIKRLEKAFGEIYRQGILQTKWIKSRHLQKFWLDSTKFSII